MSLFNLGKGINDPNVKSFDGKEKEIFALEKEELKLGDNIISEIRSSDKIIKSALSNARHLIRRKMDGHPSHDLDFNVVISQLEDSRKLLDKAKLDSFKLIADLKEITSAVTDAENIINRNLPKVRYSKIETHSLDLFNNSEYILIHEVEPLDKLIIDLNNKLKSFESFVGSLDSKLVKPEGHGDYDANNSNSLLLHQSMGHSNEINKDISLINHRLHGFKEVLHNIHHRMKSFKTKDKELHKELLKVLKNARDNNINRHNLN